MVVANIISVIIAWEQIRIEDVFGNKIYEGSCADVRATMESEILYRTLSRVVKSMISIIEGGISCILITVE